MLLLAVLWGCCTATAQPSESGRLQLHFEAMHFFQNNEYFNPRQSGYTLPGFYLRPYADWHLTPATTLQAGFHWLHYWGARNYPAAHISHPWPDSPDSASRPLHLLPWMRIDLATSRHLCLTLGNLHSEQQHYLPLPLFNPERLYATDPEAGFQLQTHAHWVDADVWVDWQEYIWHQSTQQEHFTAGLTLRPRLALGDHWQLTLPLHALVQHSGGQDMATAQPVNTQYNLAAALEASRQAGRLLLEAQCYTMLFRQQRQLTIPFSSGYGIYPHLGISLDSTATLQIGYWQSHHFLPLLGSRLFGNAPATVGDEIPSDSRMLTIGLHYHWRKLSAANLAAEGRLYHFLGEEKPLQYSFGLTLGVKPTIPLLP